LVDGLYYTPLPSTVNNNLTDVCESMSLIVKAFVTEYGADLLVWHKNNTTVAEKQQWC